LLPLSLISGSQPEYPPLRYYSDRNRRSREPPLVELDAVSAAPTRPLNPISPIRLAGACRPGFGPVSFVTSHCRAGWCGQRAELPEYGDVVAHG
jgi:hypothetical protein